MTLLEEATRVQRSEQAKQTAGFTRAEMKAAPLLEQLLALGDSSSDLASKTQLLRKIDQIFKSDFRQIYQLTGELSREQHLFGKYKADYSVNRMVFNAESTRLLLMTGAASNPHTDLLSVTELGAGQHMVSLGVDQTKIRTGTTAEVSSLEDGSFLIRHSGRDQASRQALQISPAGTLTRSEFPTEQDLTGFPLLYMNMAGSTFGLIGMPNGTCLEVGTDKLVGRYVNEASSQKNVLEFFYRKDWDAFMLLTATGVDVYSATEVVEDGRARKIYQADFGGEVAMAKVSPDGKQIAVATRCRVDGHKLDARGAGFAADRLVIFDLPEQPTGKVRASGIRGLMGGMVDSPHVPLTIRQHVVLEGAVREFSFSGNGARIVVGGGSKTDEGGFVSLIDARGPQREMARYVCDKVPDHVACDFEGERFAFSVGRYLEVFG